MYSRALGQASQVNVIEVMWGPDCLDQPRMRHVQLEGQEGRVRKISKHSHGATRETTIFSEAELRINNIAIEAKIEGKGIFINRVTLRAVRDTVHLFIGI